MENQQPIKGRWNPTERVGVHLVALTFLRQFGWIEREQPISDYGIDMHIEIAMNGNPTGQLLGLQIKTGSSYFTNDKGHAYVFDRGDKRHLEYWLDQAIPVLLVLCDQLNGLILWVHVERSKVVETINGWRIEVPKSNVLQDSKDAILRIYYDPRGFTLIDETDYSYVRARRIKAQYRVDKHFCRSRSVLRNMIPHLVKVHQESTLYTNADLKAHLGSRKADIVTLFFYGSVLQEMDGTSFCRATWVNPSLPAEFRGVETEASEIIDDGIRIQWDNSNSSLEDRVHANSLSKGEFIQKANSYHLALLEMQAELFDSLISFKGDQDLDTFRIRVATAEDWFAPVDSEINKIGFPPEMCRPAKVSLTKARDEITSFIFFAKSDYLEHDYMLECLAKALDRFADEDKRLITALEKL